MAIAFVNAAGTGTAFGGNPSIAYTPNAAGNCLVVAAISSATNGNVSSISDTNTNTWVNVFQDVEDGVSGSLWLSLWVAPNCKSGPTTITVAFSNQITFGGDIVVGEYSGAVASSVVDVSGAQFSSEFSFSTPSKTTTVANDWILSIATGCATANQPTLSSPVGYQVRENETTGRYGLVLVDSNAAEPIGSYATTFASTGILNIAGLLALKPLITTHSISGNAGIAGASVAYSGTSSGSTTADGSGNYTIAGLASGSYTITPSLAGYTFSPTSANETITSSNITGVNFTATAVVTVYSVPDCRDTSNWPNNSVTVQGTKQYTVQKFDSRKAGAPVDSRAAGAPVDSRKAPNIPENSRTQPPFES